MSLEEVVGFERSLSRLSTLNGWMSFEVDVDEVFDPHGYQFTVSRNGRILVKRTLSQPEAAHFVQEMGRLNAQVAALPGWDAEFWVKNVTFEIVGLLFGRCCGRV